MSNTIEDLEQIVTEALNQLRPYLEQDGGDMELVEITPEKIVRVKLLGNCSTCSMSSLTMRAGLEEAVKKVAPEIVRVEAVN